MITPTATEISSNGNPTDTKLGILEDKLEMVIWLHAELRGQFLSMAKAVSALLAQQMQPQMQQAILDRLTSP